MGKPKAKVVKDNAERWLLTYADLMNLLLIFFIILYALSKVDQQKFEELSDALHSVIGTNSGNKIIDTKSNMNMIDTKNLKKRNSDSKKDDSSKGSSGGKSDGKSTEKEKMDAVKQQVQELVNNEGLKGSVSVTSEERGVKVSISSKMLFKSGSSEIDPNSKPTIQDIGKILKKLNGNYFRIEGHTDAEMINTFKYPSNWELSAMRASTVLRLLVDKVGINPRNISAVGYGEYRPVVPNTSVSNMAKNRRVDIVIMKSALDDSEAKKIKNANIVESTPGN